MNAIERSGVNFPFFLAPMVGLSHIALRQVMREFLPEGAKTLWPTEMLNSRRLPNEVLGETPETKKLDFEDDLFPQILGNTADPISKSLEKLEDWGVRGVDINMGCPVKKALRHNYGVSLMGDSDYAAKVVEMTVKSTKLPISVKLRAGNSTFTRKQLLGFVKGLESAGASWLCLHPRKAEQKRRGSADWSQIKWMKEQLEIPLIGNGDVQTAEDALRMADETGCDGVMIGRAATVRPWILWQLGEALGFAPPKGLKGSAPKTPEEEAKMYGYTLKRVWQNCQEYFPTSDALQPKNQQLTGIAYRKFKFFVKVSHVWLNFGHNLDAGLTNCRSYQEVTDFLEKFFENESLSLCQRTELRY